MTAAATSSARARVLRASLLAALASSVPASALAAATGYVWAGRPTVAEYAPGPHERFSSAGGAVTVRRLGTGRYEARFDGLSLSGGTVQVSAAGAQGGRCNVSGWSSEPPLVAGVTCFDQRGQPLDAPFSMLALSRQGSGGPLAFAWADQAGTVEYEPSRAHAFNSAGGPIHVRRGGRGQYELTFTGLHIAGGNVQVTGYGARDSYCKVVRWGGASVSVACFDLSGRPADARFTVLFLGRGSVAGVSFLWGSRPTAVSYIPLAGFTHNAAPGASRIERLGVGRYALFLAAPPEPGGTALVTAYGAGATACVLGGIAPHATGRRVTVNCFRPDGAPADSAYSAAWLRLAPRPATSSPNVLVNATSYAALVAGRPYAWSGPTHQIEAVLEAASRRQGDLGLDSMTWRCQAARCTAQTFLQPTVDLCRSLAREVGKVRRFATPARALPAADLQRCNSALDAVQTVAGRMALARTQVFFAAPAANRPPDPALAAKPGPLPMPFPVYQELLDIIPEIQDDLRQAAGWDYMVYPDGKDQHKFYFLPREYRLALEDGAQEGLALSFNYLHEGSEGADVLMTARLRAPQVSGDLRLMKALAEKALIGRAGRIELVPFPIDEAQVEIADVLADFGVSAANVHAEAPDDVLDPIRLTLRMSEEAQQNLLSQLRTRHGLAGHVRLKAGDVVANVPLTLSLAEFAGAAVRAVEAAGDAGPLENRSSFPVTVKGWVGYAESAAGLRRVSLPLPRPLALEPRARTDEAQEPPAAGGQRLVHSWLDYELDGDCGPCLDAIESGATTQAGLTRRADLVVEALPSVFTELSLEKLLVEVESAYLTPTAAPEVRTFTLYPDEHRTTARLFVDPNRGADAEKARYRFRAFAAGGAGEFSPWQSTSSLDITLTPHDVRAVSAARDGKEGN